MSDSEKSIQSETSAQPKTGLYGPLLVGWLCFGILFVVCGAWLTLASISGAVIANGIVTVKGKAKSIQHADGGVITKIKVEDGQFVSKGTELIRLDDTMPTANLNIYKSRIQEAVAVRSRLLAELAELKMIEWDQSLLASVGIHQTNAIEAAQQRIFETRRKFNSSQQIRLASKITQLRNQIQGLNAQMLSLEQQSELANQELEAMLQLKAKGHGTETQLRQMKQRMANIGGRIGEVIASRARTESAIEEVQIQMLQEMHEFRSELSTELAKADLDIQNLTQQLVVTTTLLQRTVITAPVDGIVHELAAHTIGGVLQPGATVLQIIPNDNDLEIEVAFDPQSVDELYAGQEAAIRLTALNLRTTPELLGLVSIVSPDVVVDPSTNRSFYRAIVTISPSEISKLGDVTLVPGMPVEVFAKTGERSVMSYLMQPLTNQLTHALREQ